MTIRNHQIAALAAAFVMSTGAAQAATYTASKVIEDQTSYGVCTARSDGYCNANDRRSVANALGETDGSFYSLGMGGRLTLGFDKAVFAPGASVTLEEVTFGGAQRGRHYEAVDLYSVMGSVMTFVQTIYNTTASTTVRIVDRFEYIQLVDATQREYAATKSYDGFDVDSVKVAIAPIPLPAGGALLLAGLGGLALMRRPKAAA